MESAITVKGQATIAKAIREHLPLKPGDRVKFFHSAPWQRGTSAETSGSSLKGNRQGQTAFRDDCGNESGAGCEYTLTFEQKALRRSGFKTA